MWIAGHNNFSMVFKIDKRFNYISSTQKYEGVYNTISNNLKAPELISLYPRPWVLPVLDSFRSEGLN